MVDCESCNKEYDQTEHSNCPYCGHGANKKKKDKPENYAEPTLPAKNRLKFIIAGAVLLVIIAVAVLIFYISSSNSYLSVPDKYPTIQSAIDAADDGDEIVVQPGTYRENINFKGKHIILRSTDPEDSDIVERTIIDGGGRGIVVSFRMGETEEAVISGFSIINGSGIVVSGGSSPVIRNNIIEANTAEFGGGIAIFDSSPTIYKNIIVGNEGFLGGGLYIEESSPLIEGNYIVGNRAETGSGIVIISNSSPLLVDNIVYDNTANRLGGGIVIAVYSSPTLQGNEVIGNFAERGGGGIVVEESEPLIKNNTINANVSGNGGGIFIVNSLNESLDITGNIINGNFAFFAGGGIYMEGSSPKIENNTFTNNSADHYGGAVAVYNSLPAIYRNIFENNQAGEANGGGAIWVSADSALKISEPDDNIYQDNIPNDLFFE